MGAVRTALRRALRPVLRNPLQLGDQSIISRAIAILRSFSPNASSYPFSTLQGAYQTSAGPAALVVNDPVGLELDAMGTVGSELVTNGDFSDGATGWSTIQAGWSISAGAASVDSSVAGSTIIRQGVSTASAMYKVTFTVTAYTSGSVYPMVGGELGPVGSTSVGVFSFYIKALDASGFGVYAQGAGTVASIDSISCVQVTGNHASQTTAINRPTVQRGLFNLMTYSNDLSNAAWLVENGCAATSNSLSFTADASSRTYTNIAFSGTVTVAAKFSLSDAGKSVHLAVWATGLNGLSTGKSPALTVDGNGYVIYTWADTTSGTHCGLVGTGVAESFNSPSVALFQGTLTAAQILQQGGIPLTTSAAGSNPTAGPYWASFNGTNSSLQLSSVPFQMADDHCVVICFSLSSTTVNQGVFYGGAGTGWIASVYADTTNGVRIWYWNNAAGSFSLVVGSIALNEVVVVSLRCVSGVVTGKKNGVVAGTLSPTGVFTVSTAGIGTHPSLVSMAGGIYDLNVIKGTVTDAQLLVLEKAAAQRAGLVL